MSDELYYYLSADYSATGEGNTICLLITRAYPKIDRDYIVKPDFDLNTGLYNPGKLRYPREKVAILEFEELFDTFWASGAEVRTRGDFIKRYDRYVPEIVKKLTGEEKPINMPGNFQWHAQLHVNYS